MLHQFISMTVELPTNCPVGLEWTSSTFTSLTGYTVKEDSAVRGTFAIDWGAHTLVLRSHLGVTQYLMAIIGAIGLIMGGQSLPEEGAPIDVLASALAQDPAEVVMLDQERLRRRNGIELKEVARGKRSGAPPRDPPKQPIPQQQIPPLDR